MGAFIQWFQCQGAHLDTESMGIIGFPPSEGGRGAVALKDIPSGHTLFTIPRNLTISTRTCTLPTKFGLEAWRKAKLHQGWVGLILCLMWETAAGSTSRWVGYLDTLPSHFDTPMFWNEDDLVELKGTSVVEKLGKVEALADYNEKLLPAVKSRPDLFLPEHISTHYTIERYHIMGSRILSRSFIVEKWDGDDDDENEAANTSLGSAMDVDEQRHTEEGPEVAEEPEENGDDEGDDDDDDEDSSDVAMVPMADILNARYQTENAKLFYEKDELKMVSIKPIRAGEQIWNTYGDLPNAELLRRYGHVDLLPLPDGGHGNPGDVVEIKADLIVSIVSSIPEAAKDNEAKERIDWWLEQGGEDVFILDYDYDFPSVIISFLKLLLLPKAEWEKAREKSKPPKSKLEGFMYDILISTLEKRLEEYPTTTETDRALLTNDISLNKRNAIIVRLGEKEILRGHLQKLRALKESEKQNSAGGSRKRKGGADGPTSTKMKKSRR